MNNEIDFQTPLGQEQIVCEIIAVARKIKSIEDSNIYLAIYGNGILSKENVIKLLNYLSNYLNNNEVPVYYQEVEEDKKANIDAIPPNISIIIKALTSHLEKHGDLKLYQYAYTIFQKAKLYLISDTKVKDDFLKMLNTKSRSLRIGDIEEHFVNAVKIFYKPTWDSLNNPTNRFTIAKEVKKMAVNGWVTTQSLGSHSIEAAWFENVVQMDFWPKYNPVFCFPSGMSSYHSITFPFSKLYLDRIHVKYELRKISKEIAWKGLIKVSARHWNRLWPKKELALSVATIVNLKKGIYIDKSNGLEWMPLEPEYKNIFAKYLSLFLLKAVGLTTPDLSLHWYAKPWGKKYGYTMYKGALRISYASLNNIYSDPNERITLENYLQDNGKILKQNIIEYNPTADKNSDTDPLSLIFINFKQFRIWQHAAPLFGADSLNFSDIYVGITNSGKKFLYWLSIPGFDNITDDGLLLIKDPFTLKKIAISINLNENNVPVFNIPQIGLNFDHFEKTFSEWAKDSKALSYIDVGVAYNILYGIYNFARRLVA
jgi:hypothetical protein